jgi:hypothetical protein
MRLPRQQIVGRDQQSRGAKAALHRARLDEGLLQRMQRPVRATQPLDGHDVAAVRLPGGDQASADGHALQVDRARPALALLAGVLRAGQAHPLA